MLRESREASHRIVVKTRLLMARVPMQTILTVLLFAGQTLTHTPRHCNLHKVNGALVVFNVSLNKDVRDSSLVVQP